MIDFLNGVISYIETIWNIVIHTLDNLGRALGILSNTTSSFILIMPTLPTLIGTGILCYLVLLAVKFILGR